MIIVLGQVEAQVFSRADMAIRAVDEVLRSLRWVSSKDHPWMVTQSAFDRAVKKATDLANEIGRPYGHYFLEPEIAEAVKRRGFFPMSGTLPLIPEMQAAKAEWERLQKEQPLPPPAEPPAEPPTEKEGIIRYGPEPEIVTYQVEPEPKPEKKGYIWLIVGSVILLALMSKGGGRRT